MHTPTRSMCEASHQVFVELLVPDDKLEGLEVESRTTLVLHAQSKKLSYLGVGRFFTSLFESMVCWV